MRCTDWTVCWESHVYDLSWCLMIRLQLYMFRRRQQMWNAFSTHFAKGTTLSWLLFILVLSLVWCPIITLVHNKVTWTLSQAVNLYSMCKKMKFMNIKGFLQQRFTPPSHSPDLPRVLAETIFVISQSVILFSSQSWFLLYLFRVE